MFGRASALARMVLEADTGAIISPGRTYRYGLWRWLTGRLPFWQRGVRIDRWIRPRTLMFSMLNPSDADETENDNTLNWCRSFGTKRQFDLLLVGNLYGYRTPSTKVLAEYACPVGAENDEWLRAMAELSHAIVFAPGSHKMVTKDGRSDAVLKLLHEAAPLADIVTLGPKPRHPLYCPMDVKLRVIKSGIQRKAAQLG